MAVLAVALLLLCPGAGLADMKVPMTRPMVQKQAPVKPGMQQAAKDPMLAAQRWLKSIGYDLSFEQMKTLKRLVLQKYSLETTPLITNANMKHVRVLSGLEIIQIPRQINDTGIKYLEGLSNLRVVNMPVCGVTDVGLGYVAKLPRMDNLVASGCNITDVGVQKIAGRSFDVLNLTGTHITDQAIEYLKGHGINKLFLSQTAITDACVDTLISFQPSRLDIQFTQITPAGHQRLKAALPNAKIVY